MADTRVADFPGHTFHAAIAIAAVRLFQAYDAGRENARLSGSVSRFPPGRWFRWLQGCVCLLVLLAVADMIRLGSWRSVADNWLLMLLTVALTGGMGICLPRTITIGEHGVSLAPYLGLFRRYVPWEGAHAVSQPATGELIAVGANGIEIVHTKGHAGRSTFVIQLQRRIKVYL